MSYQKKKKKQGVYLWKTIGEISALFTLGYYYINTKPVIAPRYIENRHIT